MATWSEAKRAGLPIYIGKPCRFGHGVERYTASGNCVVCAKSHVAARVANGYFKVRFANPVIRAVLRKQYRERYLQNREERLRLARAWTSAHPELRLAISRSYKARRRAQEAGGISTKALCAWVAAQSKICHWCGEDCVDDFHVDHFYPLSKGGKHSEENLVIACADCNRRKSAKDPNEFRLEIAARMLESREAA